jgi:hypothetical protein
MYHFMLYKNVLVKRHSKIVFTKTWGPTFNFKAKDIHHHSCPTSFKHLNDQSKIVGLHSIIHIKQDILIKQCPRKYTTSNGLLNGVNGIFKTLTSCNGKTTIWMNFQNSKIGIITKKKLSHYNTRDSEH